MELEGLSRNLHMMDQQMSHLANQKREIKQQFEFQNRRKYTLEMEISNLRDNLVDEEPSALAHLQEIKAKEDALYEKLKLQLEPLKSRKSSLSEKIKGIKTNENQIVSGIRQIKERIKKLESELGDVTQLVMTYRKDIEFYEKKAKEYEAIVQKTTLEIESQSQIVQDAITKAGDHRVPVKHSEEEIINEMNRIQIRLEAREMEIGKKQDIMAQYIEKKGLLDTSMTEMNAIKDYLGSMDEALEQRQQTKLMLRQKISIQSKKLFAGYIYYFN